MVNQNEFKQRVERLAMDWKENITYKHESLQLLWYFRNDPSFPKLVKITTELNRQIITPDDIWDAVLIYEK